LALLSRYRRHRFTASVSFSCDRGDARTKYASPLVERQEMCEIDVSKFVETEETQVHNMSPMLSSCNGLYFGAHYQSPLWA
jgi:hypothetical protein